MVILNKEQYIEIVQFIKNFEGLSIDCEKKLIRKFNNIPAATVGSILSKEGQYRSKHLHSRLTARAPDLLREYNEKTKSVNNNTILLNMAISLKIPPLGLSRIILLEKYKNHSRSEVQELLKNPDLIDDSLLAINVSYCLFNDSQEGSITDIIRRCIGEEYEVKLKQMARDAGMVFYDEGDLRRTGFDKTPDLKLAIPCLYNGKVINWIESKASFGDMESHQKYVREQLVSYGNRFGAGIVIYWFGYLDVVKDCMENGDYIFVTDKFPYKSELEFIKFENSIVEVDKNNKNY